MIPYLGCDAARELLHPFVDGELPMADQVAVEAHLRWCRTCAARVEDMRIIGASIRCGSPAHAAADEDLALAAIQSDVLTRIGAEREQSLGVRFRGLFEDLRFFWPALGASAALMACLCTVGVMSRTARDQRPHSMADVIEMLANPGSDRNPVLLNAGMLAPRQLNEDAVLEGIPGEEVVFALAAVVTREGRIADYRLLRGERASARLPGDADAADIDALLDAVKQSRFAPAQTPGGAVAVNLVWLLARTTVKASAEEYDLGSLPRLPASEEIAKPLSVDPEPPVLRPARS